MKSIKKAAVLISVLLSLAMCFAFAASAETYEFTVDGISYEFYTVGNEIGLAVTDVDAELSGVVEIPEKVSDVEVKRIYSRAFSACKEITEIIIPSTVWKIGDSAFRGCTALEAVTFGSSVREIGENIFAGCTALDTITVAEGNSRFSVGEDGVLYNASKTALVFCPASVAGESYTVAEGVTTIRPYAFSACAELKNVSFSSTVSDIEKNAFAGTALYDDQANWENGGFYLGEWLIEVKAEGDFYVKDGTKKITKSAFLNNGEYKVIFIPLSVQEIDCFSFSSFKVFYEGTQEQWQEMTDVSVYRIYYNHPEAAHSFTNYVSDNNATIHLDGTKTAYCDYGCGEKDTVKDEGSMIPFHNPETITSTSTTSSITLNWSAVESATGYRIYYMTSNGWKKYATITATTYTFKNLKAAAKFKFAVKSYNIDGDGITWAGSYTSHETATQALTPTKITSTQNDYSVKLTWTAVKGATGYRVYVKTADGWQKRGTVTTTSHRIWNLTEGTKYTFAVRPYIKTADTLIWSAYKTYQGATATRATFVNVYKNEGGSLTIGCDNIKGAEGYQLYYKKDGAKSFKLYKTYTKNQSFTFNNLTGGDRYIFVIRAGIKKADGVIWSDYEDTAVTVNYRAKRYGDMISSGNFYFEVYDETGVYNGVAMKNGSYCLDMKADGERQRIVYNAKNKNCYVIDDTNKMYYVQKDDGTVAESLKGFTDVGAISRYKTSKEKIGSTTYFVESYTQDGITVKYYFNGSNLVKEAYIYGGENVGEVYYSKFTKTVPDSLFTVPSNYTKVTA